MVVIRLARAGATKRPFYHIVAADKRRARGGKYIERLGYFNPTATGGELELSMQRERVAYWVAQGAQLSDMANDLVKKWDKKATATAA